MCNVLHHTFFCAQMLKYTQSFCNIQHAKFIFMLISVYKYNTRYFIVKLDIKFDFFNIFEF